MVQGVNLTRRYVFFFRSVIFFCNRYEFEILLFSLVFATRRRMRSEIIIALYLNNYMSQQVSFLTVSLLFPFFYFFPFFLKSLISLFYYIYQCHFALFHITSRVFF